MRIVTTRIDAATHFTNPSSHVECRHPWNWVPAVFPVCKWFKVGMHRLAAMVPNLEGEQYMSSTSVSCFL